MVRVSRAARGGAGSRPLRPALRWLLLGCTLLGLSAMHTLGHAGMRHSMTMALDRAAGNPPTAVVMLASGLPHLTGPHGCSPGCVHLAGGKPGGDHPAGWSVCLAILAALAVAVLLGWLLQAAWRRGAIGQPTRPLALTPRGPPIPRVGLCLADLSVLRR